MVSAIGRLWRGELPLADAFWTWAFLVALPLNVATFAGSLALFVAGQPILGLVVGHVLAVPYNVLAAVGVWRAAARYDGAPAWAALARIASIAGLTLLSVV